MASPILREMKHRPPVLAHEKFAESESDFRGLAIDQVFERIHKTNLWGSPDSVSGLGSALESTARLRHLLPKLLKDLGVRSKLDIPCGDFHWLSQTPLPVDRYVGADIVEEIVQRNRAAYPQHEFLRLDLCKDDLPKVDLVHCRDCLVHLSFEHIFQAVRNLKRSGSKWLLTTHFLECPSNENIATGDWRMLNFELTPFAWPPPVQVLVEGCDEAGGGYADKTLALWPIDTIYETVNCL